MSDLKNIQEIDDLRDDNLDWGWDIINNEVEQMDNDAAQMIEDLRRARAWKIGNIL